MPHDDDLLTWRGGGVVLALGIAADQPVQLLSLRPADAALVAPTTADAAPLVEVQLLGHGRFPGSHRYADTTTGARLRHVHHTATTTPDGHAELRVRQHDPATGLTATSVFRAAPGTPAVRTWTELTAGGATLTVQAVTSACTGAFLTDAGLGVDDFDVVHGDSDWVAESRWHRTPLRRAGLAAMDPEVHHHAPRSRFALTSRSSWSTGEHLPTGALVARDDSWALAWQIEHNGAWHWEVGERRHGAYLALLGPTDTEHQWSTDLPPGQGFTTAPVSLAVAAGGLDEALGALTRQRRTLLSARPDRLPVVFNDYMNTLMGDPTTARLLPLIDAAASAGADVFCVDAGWYDEDGGWWDSVGEWRPSTTRFPGGLAEVMDSIRQRGMVPGIWLEPEVIGVRSPLARTLPDEAFFQRGGTRVTEHGRHHLDLRHPAARAHLDEVVDRMVAEFGIGYFKFDYNIMPGPGTDLGGLAPGAGLLGHNRAQLEWLDAVLDRHSGLLIENCASGAMRMDYALLSRLHLQSTSDQQNPLLYPPIAAAAPASVLPEQCGNWAYAQPGMSPDEAAFTLATGVLGRLYLSGHLNRMTDEKLGLVREAVRVHRAVLPFLASALPFWPLGLTGAEGAWVSTGLRAAMAPYETLLTVWKLPGAGDQVLLPVPHLRDREVRAEVVFPASATGWAPHWDAGRGELRLDCATRTPTACVVRLSASA
ncbi:alpha-galactosidase [Streptomyces antimycoticus]|uniref:alpha-galactosidase n=1 Tax=Streptomyces antimycoticus TaxID=68175 RepID=UPI000A39B1E2|nr:glycoside hydrolase family 36 protein [Streptomyces antimycoticus]